MKLLFQGYCLWQLKQKVFGVWDLWKKSIFLFSYCMSLEKGIVHPEDSQDEGGPGTDI